MSLLKPNILTKFTSDHTLEIKKLPKYNFHKFFFLEQLSIEGGYLPDRTVQYKRQNIFYGGMFQTPLSCYQ